MGLILERRAGESVYIGDAVKVTVERVKGKGNRARLVIDAPTDVVIDRSELREKKEADPRNVEEAA
tara:strand:+ start:428 stop:625 length:198 start_codon:yes stop_codon:yes gene_type:complete